MKHHHLLLIICFAWLQSCFKESFLPVKAEFDVRYVSDRKAAPTAIKLQNNSEGADTYNWNFEGANLTTSTDRNPPELIYTKPGKYKITLQVKNADGQTATKEQLIEIGDILAANFEYGFEINNLAPAKVKFKNTSLSGQRYEWTFENADKPTSTDPNPEVTFLKEGNHKAILKVYSGSSFIQKEEIIKVGPALTPDFELTAQDFNFNWEAPLQLKAISKTRGGITYQWSVNDPLVTVTAGKDSIAGFNLTTPKTYTIRLSASNGKETKVIEKQVEVKPATNLLSFENIKLGVYPNSKISNYYVSRRNQSIPYTELDTLKFGKELDIVFFSRDTDFSYARFISPDKAAAALLPAVPQAKQTIFINLLEGCEACTKVSASQFAAIKSGKDFGNFTLRFGDGVVEGFSASQGPRFVPFKTSDGRIGIIRIKEFVKESGSSYILTDIKVMRKPN